MNSESFINKEEIKIGEVKFLISNIPAVPAQDVYGEIVRYSSDTGDIGMTFLPIGIALKLLAYAAFWNGKEWESLETEGTINEACKDILTLIKLEAAMIRKNFGFLFDGNLQKVLEDLRKGKPVT